jgi:DNA-binding SARP family transcriptional activator
VHGVREFDRARALIRRLDRGGRLRPAIEADPSLLATVAWALQAQPQEALAMLDKYDGDARADVTRYMIEAVVATRPVTPPVFHDMPDVDRLMSWGLFIQGRLGELARMEPTDDGAPLLNPNVALAAAFRGDGVRARHLWSRVPTEIQDRPQSRFILAMLELDAGSRERAKQELRQAVADSHRTGFSIKPVYEVFLAYVRLVDEDENTAIELLEPLLEELSRDGQTALVEFAQCFLGIGYLRAGRDVEARLILRDAVASMQRAQRRLLLSMAAAALAEAEARLGDEEAAHRAAETAYHAAQLIGSFTSLVRTVRLFPDVQRREVSRRPDDSRWRRLVAAPSARPTVTVSPRSQEARRLVLKPFGRDRDLVLDGEPVGIGRTKILELVACLALHPHGIDRHELQQRLFPEADQRSGGNHFRQIAHKLRHGTDIVLDRRGNLVLFPQTVTVVAEDIESERLLVSASSVAGQERRGRLLDGLARVTGSYLEGSALPWVEERRNYLALVHEEARLELATLHLELGDPDAARTVCEQVLEHNRYSDPAYRVLVEIERTVGSESSALAVYRRAAAAMAELGLTPGIARSIMHGGRSGAARPAGVRGPEARTPLTPTPTGR